MLKLETVTEGANATVKLDGRLDTTTAYELETLIKELAPKTEKLTLDCANLEYVSSAGLRVLLSAHKTMSAVGGMTITNVGEMVNEVFDLTGFNEILNIA